MIKMIKVTNSTIVLDSIRGCFNWLKEKDAERIYLVEKQSDGGLTIHYYLARKAEPNDPVKIPQSRISDDDILATWWIDKRGIRRLDLNPDIANHMISKLELW